MYCWLTLLCALVLAPVWVSSVCNRYPTSSGVEKSPVDENFAVLIRNNPQNYILGQEYNVTLNAYNGHRYVAFSLALENENGDAYAIEDLGHFKIIDPVETRFSPNCGNMVESTNHIQKTCSEVTWVAPTNPTSGCVLIRATVLQHRDVWHMDDGGLTRRICQEVVDEVESRTATAECCACDEARYELIFQGNWNRNLHPKDFPPKGWITRFGDIIGAAHTVDYRFWNEGILASEGMQEYAEHSSTRLLEREFNKNFQNGTIRTIIKSRGLSFPNLNGISVASVRVDPQHHLISLVSKIDPSPDWFVGISGMELCMTNCTWLEERVIKLFPWDAGTDSGPSYTSPDEPQLPADVIKRIRTNFPNDPRSPFYDETNAAMFPMATLTVKRQRVYERNCEDEDSNNIGITRECYTHPWTPWSECTAKCGDGHSTRVRVYKQPELAKIYNCDVMIELRESRTCKGENCIGPEAELIEGFDSFIGNPSFAKYENTAACELSSWSPWSECSKTCGEGTMFRRRQFQNPRTREACQGESSVKLVEYKKCNGQLCLGDLYNNRPYEFGGDDSGFDGNNIFDNRAQEFDGNGFNSNNNFNNGQENEYMNRAEQEYRGGYSNNQQRTVYKEKYDNKLNNQQPWNDQQYRGDGYNNNNGDTVIDAPDLLGNNQGGFEVGNLNLAYADNDARRNNEGKYSKPLLHSNNAYNRNYFDSRVNRFSGDHQAVEYVPPLLVPAYCFQKLQMFNCPDPTVVANYWFFNYCQNECMIYAADRCDKNENQFSSLEDCELMCQRPENEAYLKQQQATTCTLSEKRRIKKRRKYKNF